MSNQSSIYNEKKIASYEGTFKENAFAKPQDVNLTVTAEHIYGLAYIVEQTGTIEGDPVYTRFSCSFDEISKVYTGDNQKKGVVYVQCDKVTKGTLVRKRIVIPGIKNAEEAAEEIESLREKAADKRNKMKESVHKPAVTSSALNSGNAVVANAAAEMTKAASEAVAAVLAENAYQQSIRDSSPKNIKDLGKDIGGDIMKGFGSVRKRVENLAKATKSKAVPKAPVQVEITEAQHKSENSFTGSVVNNDDFFNSIPVPKKNASAPVNISSVTDEAKTEAIPAKTEEPTAEEISAVSAETSVHTEEAPVKPEKTFAASAKIPEPVPAVPETLQEADISEKKSVAEAGENGRPKVTIEDLLKLNDSFDDDFLNPAFPPITGGKENAAKYLDEIGGSFDSSERRPDSEAAEGITERIVLEDMNNFTPYESVRTEPEIDELPEVIDASKLISDMTGGTARITDEQIPIERMDFIPKSHHKTVEKIMPEEKADALLQLEETEKINILPEAEETAAEIENVRTVNKTEPASEAAEPAQIAAEDTQITAEPAQIAAEPAQIAAEDAYISDETVADTAAEESEENAVSSDSEVPEVKNVHIDFSTEVTNDTSLEDFEERVKKLKSMLDSGLITKEEFSAEKKKLLETLY